MARLPAGRAGRFTARDPEHVHMASCDQVESAVAWKYGVERQDGRLRLSSPVRTWRSRNVLKSSGKHRARWLCAERLCRSAGTDFIATGSEVELAVAAYEKLTVKA